MNSRHAHRRAQMPWSNRGDSYLRFSTSSISKMLMGTTLLSCIVYMANMHRMAASSLVNCTSGGAMIPDPRFRSRVATYAQSKTIQTNISSITYSDLETNKHAASSCQTEYNRLTSKQTPGLTKQDLLRSRAWVGNQYRLAQTMKSLSSRDRPVVAVVAGGSISVGHGVTPQSVRYAERLEAWMNEMFPLSEATNKNNHEADSGSAKQSNYDNNQHKVVNVAAHGADMCSMAKRLNILYSDLSSRMPTSSNDEPDLIILEFGVNDYQGQDHLISIDHKTSVFFDGFRDLTLCAEVVIHSLLTRYPNAAIMFLEMQTAIVTRKTGALLHLGVAQHYQIPVISYSEAMFPDFFRLIHLLDGMDDGHLAGRAGDSVTYSFKDEAWMEDGGIGSQLNNGNINSNNVSKNASPYASAILPYPHGCSPCQSQHIIPQFRQGGCKSICTFVERSGIVHGKKLKCNAKQGDIQPGSNECFVPFLAHDAVHPSAAGHGIAMDLIVNALTTAHLHVCKGYYVPQSDVLPLTTFVAESFDELEVRGNFLWVRDVARIFSRWDELKPIKGTAKNGQMGTTDGFKMYADDGLKQRPGWIATNPAGGEKITFAMDLKQNECYVVYVALLRSYEGMGTMHVEVRDYGNKSAAHVDPITVSSMKVDGQWDAPISVWSDVQITEDKSPGCTGYCEITVTTEPTVSGRTGNKVKLLTLSARKCSSNNQ